MNLLAIETASESCSVALQVSGDILQRYRHAPRQHAELLLPWVQQLMAEAGIGYAALDGIAFSRGPGSFTSLRIGIGVVQGLAWASNLPVIPVSSLAATAQAIAGDNVKAALVALDARMNEVFTGYFETDDNGVMLPVGKETVCAPGMVRTPKNTSAYAIGAGFERYPALSDVAASLAGVRADVWPRASAVLALARHWLQSNDPLPAEQAQPVYLRDDVAKKPRS